jgi:hypothetical protein
MLLHPDSVNVLKHYLGLLFSAALHDEVSLYHFSKVIAEIVNCPHLQPISQKGRKGKYACHE